MADRATVCEWCGSGLLDGEHIASYPPCNGADDHAALVAEAEAAKAAVDESLKVHQANVGRLLGAMKAVKESENSAKL